MIPPSQRRGQQPGPQWASSSHRTSSSARKTLKPDPKPRQKEGGITSNDDQAAGRSQRCGKEDAGGDAMLREYALDESQYIGDMHQISNALVAGSPRR